MLATDLAYYLARKGVSYAPSRQHPEKLKKRSFRFQDASNVLRPHYAREIPGGNLKTQQSAAILDLCSRKTKLRPRPHASGYFRIRNFFFPDTATVHTYPANSTANPEKNKSALQSGKKYIRNESDNVWRGESGYFFIR